MHQMKMHGQYLTVELRKVLDRMVSSRKTNLNALIENLLREHPDVVSTQNELGVAYRFRRPHGYKGSDAELSDLEDYYRENGQFNPFPHPRRIERQDRPTEVAS